LPFEPDIVENAFSLLDHALAPGEGERAAVVVLKHYACSRKSLRKFIREPEMPSISLWLTPGVVSVGIHSLIPRVETVDGNYTVNISAGITPHLGFFLLNTRLFLSRLASSWSENIDALIKS